MEKLNKKVSNKQLKYDHISYYLTIFATMLVLAYNNLLGGLESVGSVLFDQEFYDELSKAFVYLIILTLYVFAIALKIVSHYPSETLIKNMAEDARKKGVYLRKKIKQHEKGIWGYYYKNEYISYRKDGIKYVINRETNKKGFWYAILGFIILAISYKLICLLVNSACIKNSYLNIMLVKLVFVIILTVVFPLLILGCIIFLLFRNLIGKDEGLITKVFKWFFYGKYTH